MSTVYDLRQSDDPRDVVHRAVEALANGEVVVMPTEAEYIAAASSTKPEALRRLGELRETGTAPGLLFRSGDAVGDWVPHAGRVARRLLDRCSPGPIVYSWDAEASREGAIDSLSEETRAALSPDERLRGWVPSSEFVTETLELLPDPLAFVQFSPEQRDVHAPPETVEGNGLTMVVDGSTRFASPTTWVDLDGDGYRITRSGCVEDATVHRLASRVIIFVCTGNTCRSPMAAGLFKKLIAERLGCDLDELPDRGFLVESAGLSAGYGYPASPEAITLLAERGVDLREHVSRPLTAESLAAADHVWTMTSGHLAAIRSSGVRVGSQCELLARSGGDVADPFGGTRDHYSECLRQIEELLRERLEDVLPREGESSPSVDSDRGGSQ